MRGYNPRGNYDRYGNSPHLRDSGGGGGGAGSHGQMVINMKTTVTTSGGQHNGLVVHSAVQSAASPSTSNGEFLLDPT
uniref:Uncharacterized protein n=1 Tax=Caenorhabditis japonica TaxID=281687 RepID=A0A8R1DUH5_CAEJA